MKTCRAAGWVCLGVVLLAWNGWWARYANPLTLLQPFDGMQYQLLARNRLAGHDHIGDTTHLVGREGRHPMWRPGLVLVEETLARGLGSVQAGAAAASALGTALLEWLVLWLAWRCFGRATCIVAALLMFAPYAANAFFLRMALGQGPEPWAAAMILLSCAALCEARRTFFNGRCYRLTPWLYAAAAGLAGGSAELFRSGNWLLFAVPLFVCGVDLCRAGRRGWTLPLASLIAYAGMSFLADRLVPSPAAKTVVNLSHNLVEARGPFMAKPRIDDAYVSLGGFHIVPGTAQTYYDHLVLASHDERLLSFLCENGPQILCNYRERLVLVVRGAAAGLRDIASTLVVALFALQLLTCCWGRGRALPTLALGGAALAQYLGPITLLGADVCVYLLVPLPLMVIVAAAGAVRLRECLATAGRKLAWRVPALLTPSFTAALACIPLACLGVRFYHSAWTIAATYAEQARVEQAHLDALGLDGERVVTHTARWFADRDVELIMLPYATVAEIEDYVRARRAAGILLWQNDPDSSADMNVYGSFDALIEALEKSGGFDTPKISGGWRWYALRRASSDDQRPRYQPMPNPKRPPHLGSGTANGSVGLR